MSEIWVVNASPVITLARVDHLDLLAHLSAEVHVPEAVAGELMAGAAYDPARQALERGWGVRIPAGKVPQRVLEWGLGAGESSVMHHHPPNCAVFLSDQPTTMELPSGE